MTRERRLQCERTTRPLRPPLFQRGFVATVPAAKMTRHSVSLGAARQPHVRKSHTPLGTSQSERSFELTKLCESCKCTKQASDTIVLAIENSQQKYDHTTVQL